ncbi:MAG: transposase [Pseudomonadota bacterium]
MDELDPLTTPAGGSLPPLALAELRRDIARLRFIEEQIREIERERRERAEEPVAWACPRARMRQSLTRVVGIGTETADMLVNEVLARDFRDRRGLARDAGLTGLPDESGARRRERGLARAGNARVRTARVQLARRFLVFRKESALVEWYRARTADGRGRTRLTMIVALARKLLVALWRMATTGEVPAGLRLRPPPVYGSPRQPTRLERGERGGRDEGRDGGRGWPVALLSSRWRRRAAPVVADVGDAEAERGAPAADGRADRSCLARAERDGGGDATARALTRQRDCHPCVTNGG